MICGGLATKSQRITAQDDQVVVAAGETYEARCRSCFDPDFTVQNAQPKPPVSKSAAPNSPIS
jgi:thymidine kinase